MEKILDFDVDFKKIAEALTFAPEEQRAVLLRRLIVTLVSL